MLRFEKTCEACPEQYDIFQGDKLVGYARLRWGQYTVSCPDTGGEIVYSSRVGYDGWDGTFENETQRKYHLECTTIAIEKWLERQKCDE